MSARKKAPETGTEVVDWEAQMRAQAEIAAGAQRSAGGGGRFFSVKAGQLAFDGNTLPGNQMAVVILADVMENSWYEGAYNPDVAASPKCFAFGHEEADMEPHEAVDNDPYFDRQHPQCSGCPHAEWGSAPVGKGKACKNVMRLALIPAGQYTQGKGRNAAIDYTQYDEPEHFRKADVAFLKVPVTSVALYAKYVKQLAADLGRPPHGVITNIYVEPHPKFQFQVKFELIDKLDTELLPVVMPRHSAELASIDFPYQPPAEDDDKPAGATTVNNKLRGQKGAKGRGK